MLDELRELNEKRSDLLWLMKVRAADYFEKSDLEKELKSKDAARISRISLKYYTINDVQLTQLLCAVTFRIDCITSQISLEELSGLI